MLDLPKERWTLVDLLREQARRYGERSFATFKQGGSLYRTSPLAKGTTVLAIGPAEGQPEEPVAWTFERADKGRSFYTSLGHVDDFENPAFVHLLVNGLHWAAGIPAAQDVAALAQP